MKYDEAHLFYDREEFRRFVEPLTSENLPLFLPVAVFLKNGQYAGYQHSNFIEFTGTVLEYAEERAKKIIHHGVKTYMEL